MLPYRDTPRLALNGADRYIALSTFFAKAIWLGLRKFNMSPHYVQSANPTVVYARFLITIHDQRTRVISKFSSRLRKVGHKDMKPSSSQNCPGVGDVKGKDGRISSLGFPSCLTPGAHELVDEARPA